MSRDGSVVLPFVDGEKTFKLDWGHLIRLQEEIDAGPYVIYRRLMTGGWRMKDISSTIRLGLIGGGMEAGKAQQFVRGYVESCPPLDSLGLAQGILGVALQGALDEEPGEHKGEAATDSASTISPTANGE
jgi:hypothetical protein